MHEKIDRSPRLIIRVPEIRPKSVAMHIERHLHTEGGITDTVTVNIISKGIAAVGEGGEGRPYSTFGLSKDSRETGLQALATKPLRQLVQTALTKGTGGNHGFRVPTQQIRKARVPQDETIGFVVKCAPVTDLDGRNGNAFLKNLRGQG